MRSIMIIMFLAIVCLGLPFLFPCQCLKCRAEKTVASIQSTNEWQRGEFVTSRKIYSHQRCGGQMVFSGQSEAAPYSETERFYTHVCDLCGTTNQILNTYWPQYKREWRPL